MGTIPSHRTVLPLRRQHRRLITTHNNRPARSLFQIGDRAGSPRRTPTSKEVTALNSTRTYTSRTHTSRALLNIPAAIAATILAAFSILACYPQPEHQLPPTVDSKVEPLPTPTHPPIIYQGHMPSLADAVQKIRPAVVSITTYHTPDRSDVPGAATGVIIDERGLVITNNHAIDQADWIVVTTDSGYQTTAQIAGTDPLTDLALLTLPQARPYPFVRIRPDIPIRPAEWVAAIGNALALPGGPTVTVGVISATSRTVSPSKRQPLYNVVQTDTPINPGNSGGPLINSQGDIIGINTAIIRGNARNPGQYQGIGFAISADTVAQVSQHLADTGHVPWAWLGLFMDDLTPETAATTGARVRNGVLITGVVPDGPADQAGITDNDVITAIDSTPTPTVDHLINTLRKNLMAGDQITLGIIRQGEPLSLELTLGERPTG